MRGEKREQRKRKKRTLRIFFMLLGCRTHFPPPLPRPGWGCPCNHLEWFVLGVGKERDRRNRGKKRERK